MQIASKNRIVYTLVVEDIQNEAIELLGRKLDKSELITVERKLSDILEWDFYVREAIKQTI